jgi:SAM-dependent methyltransferase
MGSDDAIPVRVTVSFGAVAVDSQGKPSRQPLAAARRTAGRLLDRLGLVVFVYDVKARLGYRLDARARAKNDRFRASGRHDGLPLPPPDLVYAITGHFDVEEYYETGRKHAAGIRDLLVANGVSLDQLRSLLDFGCGCGRVVRHWQALENTKVQGSDYNPKLVEWCRDALPFANFGVNRLEPPLPFSADELEFVYAISVFTHLPEELQDAWLAELERVLAPGGLLLITTKGRSWFDALTDAERTDFERGKLVVQATRYAGKNLCAAFHPEQYLREHVASSLRLLQIVPATDRSDFTQDLVLLQKPADGP